ncbi:DUF4253 domain-containing protein [Streptomyces sp. NBC_01142]|uniref:DUF4253 domain-containing protein n=1 Tax=Streptomyces sp. NBC_01142 TaxID=2975865 RepID=UPI002254640D|nr:DUF4253 domain-containing protein [Streptomyces sp. NBC_01142]MCX4818529.1 DUF4253 domain-containing protein [Streptomyces sp. NBC_01142]
MATLPNPLPALTVDPTGRSAGLALPPGTLVDATHDGRWHEPLLWYADEPASPDAWAGLLSARKAVGLHPVLIHGGSRDHWPEEWELSPDMASYAGDHDAEEVLADFWEEYAEEELGEDSAIEPFGPEWPGLAASPSPQADPDVRAAEVAADLADEDSWMRGARMALVPARRSADIPAAIGWTGPLNYENDVARLCAVLRSWEDRFGIRVVALSFDQLVLSVASPPTTMTEAEAVAAEHFAFCPDSITQNDHDTLRAYAARDVLGRQSWSFWWD